MRPKAGAKIPGRLWMTSKAWFALLAALGIAFIVPLTGCHYMSARTKLTGKEAHWFSSPEALNARMAEGGRLVLHDVLMQNNELAGAHLNDANFDNVGIDNVGLKGAMWSDVTVRDADISYTDLRDATLSDVAFQGVHFKHPSFAGETYHNVRFVDCIFDNTIVSDQHGDEVVFDHAHFPELTSRDNYQVNFAGSNTHMVFRHTRLTWPDFAELKPGASLTFIDSTVEHGDVGFGHIEKIEAKDSHLRLDGNRSRIERVDIQGGYTRIRFTESTVGTITAKDTQLAMLNALGNSKIGSFRVSGCDTPIAPPNAFGIALGDVDRGPTGSIFPSHFGHISISNCSGIPLYLRYVEAVRDTRTPLLMLNDSHIEELDLAHVTVREKADIRRARVKGYRRYDVKRDGGAHYLHEGVNFALFGPDTDNALKTKRGARPPKGGQAVRQKASRWGWLFGR